MMLRKTLLVLLVLAWGFGLTFAGTGPQLQKVSKADRQKAFDGTEVIQGVPSGKALQRSTPMGAATPPGVLLMRSTYGIHSNGSMGNTVVNYGDGTVGVARMAATTTGSPPPDRGSWWTYFDGSTWSPPIKVETRTRGWTTTDIMADGRQVICSHIANEVNVDAVKGLGLFTSSITGYIAGATDHIWPRVAVDGKDNIHIVSTVRAKITGARYGTYYPVHTWSTDQGVSWNHKWIFGDPFTELDTSGGQWQGFAVDSYAIDAFGPNKVAIVALAGGSIAADNLWLAESEDNGATFTLTKLTDNPNLPAPGVDEFRPTTAMDVIYDPAGNVHVFSTNFLVRLDSAGTGADFFHSVTAPFRHWSKATGWVDILTYQDIPNYDPTEDIFSGGAVSDVGQNNTVIQMPNAGVDAAGNLYVVFNTVAPHDTTEAGTNFMDVYVVGSGDGGKTWGPPVNVSNSPGTEDMWASLADLVDDSLHIVYASDPLIGHTTDGSAGMDHYYYAFPKSQVPLKPVSVRDKGQPETLPKAFALSQNYPNPFNPSTTIAFDLPKASEVRLKVYTVAGQEVATVVNGILNAGRHTYTWQAPAELASGVYFYKLQTADFVSVKKMLLLK